MKIIPAIDVLDGEVVRLQMGDPQKKKVYGSLEKYLKLFYENGLSRVHVVDLDSAFGKDHSSVWDQLKDYPNMQFQVGGGIRSLKKIERYLTSTQASLVLGSYLTSQSSEALASLKHLPGERLVAAFDVAASEGEFIVKDDGWKKSTGKSLETWLELYSGIAFSSVLVTDIACDGMMLGPNFNLYRRLVKEFPSREFIASGGVRGLDDLRLLQSCGAQRAVVGRSFYEGEMSLGDLLCRV